MHLLQLPWTTSCVVWTFALNFVAGACWIPLVVIQIRMHRLAEHAAACNEALPPQYFRWWCALGVPAFIALLIVFWLMIAKPS